MARSMLFNASAYSSSLELLVPASVSFCVQCTCEHLHWGGIPWFMTALLLLPGLPVIAVPARHSVSVPEAVHVSCLPDPPNCKSYMQILILYYRTFFCFISDQSLSAWKKVLVLHCKYCWKVSCFSCAGESLCQNADHLRQGLLNNYNYDSTMKMRANRGPNSANNDVVAEEWARNKVHILWKTKGCYEDFNWRMHKSNISYQVLWTLHLQ